ncbi:citrate lyase subunit beta [Novosphingobium marinum]|uniref:Citrate lyase subunit beta/citryl-CoA lyase n=1 Tax=Novosphingobium marinum TaxID=1514948 RepID=A0A7Z0BV40_9SPHN|nr:CoA ester lyase [Novosphingobium marinum]NYH94955.1 citrate lyase subunit beta/citryl-CoA lyase [Novosphingobium marinum]GGC41306.1 citrate lyase subunit beta [Novosphingobium marinum]
MTVPQSRPRRSVLYLPASNSRAIEKARTLDCDCVILDLEDAVAPDAKAEARESAVGAVRDGGFGRRELVVRVNGIDSDWSAEDCAALREAAPDAVLLPKIDDGEALRAYRAMLGGDIALWAMIETARSMLSLREIAQASNDFGVTCWVMGTNDLVKELDAVPPADRSSLMPFLAMSVAAARGYGIEIIDGVYNAFDDIAGFERECAQGVALGFGGKTLIHPRQIDPCNRAFSPSGEEVEWSRKVVAAFDRPENADKGALKVEGRMVERLHLARAQKVLAVTGEA